ncbi:MAG: hypothetical protein AB1815_06440 [Bacillota bacterium]
MFLMLGLSFLEIVLGVLCLMLTWKWGKRKYERLIEVEGAIRKLKYPEYGEMLLKKYRVDFKLKPGLGNIGGICDFAKKEIRLTHKPGVMSFDAFWEVAHEVGHAVNGQFIFAKNKVLLSFICLTIIISFVTGLKSNSLWIPILWLPIILLVCICRWRDEVRASEFAAAELTKEIGPYLPATRLALDRIYLAMESASIALLLMGGLMFFYYATLNYAALMGV